MNDFSNTEYHLAGVTVLHDLPVQASDDAQVLRIPDFAGLGRLAHGAEGVKALPAAELAPTTFELPPSGTDIIGHSKVAHILQGIRELLHIFAVLPEDHSQFPLVVDLWTRVLANLWNDDSPGVAQEEARWVLHEY